MEIMNVSLDQRVVGTVEMQKKGLYYQLCCRCKLPAGKIYRLKAVCEHNTVDLGICVPFEDDFGVDKSVPVKCFDTKIVSFYLFANSGETNDIFIPLETEKPFSNLQNIMDAKFERRDGVPGLLLTKH